MLDAILADFAGSFRATPLPVSVARLLAAIVLGGIVGLEREWQHKPAGLRTHILVAVAACLFILVSEELALLDFGNEDAKRIDPLRLVEAVTAGVAFLAAGVIFTSGGTVRNVTTGASMWLAGAIGLACGTGNVPLALLAAVIVVAVLSLLGWIERSTFGASRGAEGPDPEPTGDHRLRGGEGGAGAGHSASDGR